MDVLHFVLPPVPSQTSLITPTPLFTMTDWLKYGHFETAAVHVALKEKRDPPKSATPPRKVAKRKKADERPQKAIRFSALSRSDHLLYLQATRLERQAAQKGEQAHLAPRLQTQLKALRPQVLKEQQEFRECQKADAATCSICERVQLGEVADALHPHDNHTFLFPEVEAAVQILIAARRQRVRQYPQLYGKMRDVELATLGTVDTTWSQVTTDLTKGKLPKYVLSYPQPWRWIDPKRSPFRGETPVTPDWRCKRLTSPCITTDPTALLHCTRQGAEFALSASTFLALATLVSDWDREVHIPLKVVAIGERTCVLLDKPLATSRVTPRTLNTVYYKHALLMDGLQETVRAHPPSHNETTSTPPPHTDNGTDTTDTATNTFYDLFQLGSFRLLIRRKLDAYGDINGGVHYLVRAKMEYLNKGFALEMDGRRHLEFEQLTNKELLDFYFSLLLRDSFPNTRLLVGRVNVFASCVLRIDQFTLASLKAFLHSRDIPQPAQALGALHRVLQELKQLEVGSYLLTHASGETQVSIHQQTDKAEGASVDLHAYCEAAGTLDTTTVTFIPPTDEITAQHWQIPNTFPLHSPMWEGRRTHPQPVESNAGYNHSSFYYTNANSVVQLTPQQLLTYASSCGYSDPSAPEELTEQIPNYEAHEAHKLSIFSDSDTESSGEG
eukprot:NODE_491_length_2153_cov_86.498026_g455_i0.p1 GENE.NODE_491_length_2153_cov_86.498026_g455_i0~~NODE_491_length_2153_cov_86.498026_g455_i0.p1  ORF type:complete len:679 (+),score=206.73 NODE_491_length_2153_cov_86.498026_g455_i0:28-2037(+)